MKKIILIFFVVLVTLILAGPWLLYAIGLTNVSGRPTLPITSVTDEEAKNIWVDLKETGSVRITKIGPWDYILMVLAPSTQKKPVGMHATWFVVSDYNINQLKNKNMLYWHISGAAMTIWLSRNWTTEEILSKVKEIRKKNAESTYRDRE